MLYAKYNGTVQPCFLFCSLLASIYTLNHSYILGALAFNFTTFFPVTHVCCLHFASQPQNESKYKCEKTPCIALKVETAFTMCSTKRYFETSCGSTLTRQLHMHERRAITLSTDCRESNPQHEAWLQEQ